MRPRWLACLTLLCGLLAPFAAAAALDAAPGAVLPADYRPWPREVVNGAITYRIYEPQAESWNGSDVKFRTAVAVTEENGTRYGIAYGQARTWIESGTGLVKLEGIRIDRLNFPTAPDGGEGYLRDLQRAATGTWLVRREQLDPSQVAAQERIPVRNDPPRIFVSYSPALLVLIDGQPVFRSIPSTPFERVINTRVLLLRDTGAQRYYLRAFDGWLMAREAIGPWQVVTGDTSRLDEVQRRFSTGEVDLLDGGEARPSLRGGAPVIYVSTTPAELLVLTGEPQLEPIAGTHLLWVKNTSAPLLLDTGSDYYYTVISGRWFRAPTLNGPWSFAPSDRLPGDLALIPDNHALAPLRAAVPGTPQAREAVIANSVPQTTTVRRSEARFEASIDGEPQLRSIEGTALTYVVNSPTPIIRVDADSWYAVDRGVWFTASGVDGPWQVATSVPPSIYAIPATSPLHYVTYVKVYGATPDEVYTGYTPGYMGAVVAPVGTVVVGTGAYVSPWIGSAWYGTPWTYGCGWSVGVGPYWPAYNPWCSPWWGPAYGGWWRPPVYAWGPRPWWGGAPPPAWGWGRPPGWGWGKPGWPAWRPPIYSPPLPRPPIAYPPGRPPGIWPPPGGRPPGGFPPPGGRPPVALPAPRPQPGVPVGPGWGQAVSGRGPGWGNTATTPGVGAPAFPQSFRGAPPATVPPRVGGMATPELRTGAPMIAPTLVPRVESIARPLPGGAMAPGFRGVQPVAPPLTTSSPIRGPVGGFPAPGAAAAYPRFNAPAPAAMPRGIGGMPSPGAPAMAPRVGAPAAAPGGFHGVPAAPRGPGWGR
ncbi:MAG: hypothetical protein U1E63_11620 [Burkholderiales bacterium]